MKFETTSAVTLSKAWAVSIEDPYDPDVDLALARQAIERASANRFDSS